MSQMLRRKISEQKAINKVVEGQQNAVEEKEKSGAAKVIYPKP